jgi:ligand-binding sensor domain-containing protein/two-component sensor histidine kinase
MDSRVDPGKEPRLSRSLGSCVRLSIPLLAGLMSAPAFGLDPGRSLTQYIHRIQQIQGLPQATIFSILQTHDGYLWLGTQRGLVRFDGVGFTSPPSSNGVSLQDTWIRSLLEDEQHSLWIGSNDAGLVRLRDGVMSRYSTVDGLPSTSIRCLAPGRPGEFWGCTANGLVRAVNGKFIAYGASQGLSTVDIRAACATADGRLWAGGDSSELNVWDGARFTRHSLSSLPKNAIVRAMVCSKDGAIWIGTSSGLIRLMNGKERLFTKADGLADEWVDTLAEGSGGSLWIGTKNGFSRFLNGEMESFQAKDGLSQSSVYALHEDREGILWVGTKHGLDQFFDGRTFPVTASEGLPSNDTGPVFQDNNGTIWVGTLGAGLGRFNGRRFSALRTGQGPGGNTIRALAEDYTGGLWVGTDAGLHRLRGSRVERTYTTEDGLPANAIRCLFRDSRGELWAGTPKGAAVFRAGRFVPQHGGVPVLTLGEDRQGRLFAATEGGGLEIYAAGTPPEVLQNTAPARDVDALYTDRDGLLWMGTLGGGLRLLKDGKVFTFWMKDGLFDDDIYGIAGDDRDRLWMACSNGIFSVNRSDLLKFAAGAIKKFASTPYIPTDALRTIECKPGVQPAVWKMRDGALWFSTIKGVIVLDPSRLDRKLAPPPVVIEEVTVNGQREEPRRIESMLPGQKNLGFRYTGLSYYSPSRITFRYKLDGFENNWTDAGARRDALYANLPPGKFVFRVIACNVDGTCDSTGSSVAFALAPEYYQRAWFFPLCAGLIAFSVWILYRLRIRDFKGQFTLILAERSRIARELHDTLIQGFSGVTMEMQALCARLSSPEERGTLQEIVQDAARSLREARRSVAGLRGAPGDQSGLGSAIAQAARQITEAKDIRLKLELEQNARELPKEIEYNLLRIAQEAVSNSVKHSGARMIEVSLRFTAALVSLAITDDGSGFGVGAGGSAKAGHYGLIGMRERATHIGAGFEIDSESGRGTTIRVMLPDPSRPWQKLPESGKTGGTACPTTNDQYFIKLVGQAFSLSGLLPRAARAGNGQK